MAPAANISEDWEEVDDNYSVVSLPASEDGEHGLDSPAQSHASDSPVRLPLRPKPVEPIGPKFIHDGYDNDVETFGRDLKDVQEPARSQGTLNEILDVDLDPGFLHQIITSLIKLVVEIIGVVNFRGNFDVFEGAAKIRAQLEVLKTHLKNLAPIMEGYSKHWKPEGSGDRLPIDPGIYEWMASFRVELLGLQAILQNQLGKQASTSNQKWDSLDTKYYQTALMEFSSQMESFLPILQADYDEFHTSKLKFLSLDDTPAPPSQERGKRLQKSCSMHMPPGSDVFHLRRELYALKDQLSACISEFTKQQKSSLLTSSDWVPLVHSYRNILTSLGLMLSNHPSDWIDYSTAGGLTYAEFCRLNPDTIRSLNLQLKETADRLYVERNRVQSIRYMSHPDDFLSHEPSANETDMNTLRATEEVLVSILRIRPAAKADGGPVEGEEVQS
ncbi:hypothetical protein F5B20DRAFT_189907 [Whalleya microplaca]|nr:hypothetical protein F5B20DRAFT_189907 [Whalleya microplaca]